MAKITREQFNKWNAQAKNGFSFDLEYFLTWSEKTLTKRIEIHDGIVIEFTIQYKNEYETITNEYGCKWNQQTGKYIPMLYITRWKPSPNSGCYYSSGREYSEILGTVESSKKYNVLCKYSEQIDTEKYMENYRKPDAVMA